jgi:hypothetical protein
MRRRIDESPWRNRRGLFISRPVKDGRLSAASKLLRDACLFEKRVGGVPGLDLLIDDEVVIRDRTETDRIDRRWRATLV